jgi:uncharacterized membrane protein YbhN (UPF0104 family)
MRPTLLSVHLACLLLVALDLLARSVRIRWYLRGLGTSVSLGRALVATTWGDAAAGLTPLRFGGEAAKFAGLVDGGVAAGTAVAALAIEALFTYPLVAAFGLWLAWRFAPAWWAHTRPALDAAVLRGWPWLIAVGALLLGCGYVAVRWRRRMGTPGTRSGLRENLRRMPLWPLLAGGALSAYNILARTAVLPLLAASLPDHPPFGVMVLGSFALLYSQLVLPTPAGVGAVDFGFLAGVAGNLGPGAAGLLLAWRFYTVGAGALLGLALALHRFGWAAVRRLGRGDKREEVTGDRGRKTGSRGQVTGRGDAPV